MKFCKDCKHFVNDQKCSFSEFRDPVTGDMLYARFLRLTSCGREGKKWELKLSPLAAPDSTLLVEIGDQK